MIDSPLSNFLTFFAFIFVFSRRNDSIYFFQWKMGLIFYYAWQAGGIAREIYTSSLLYASLASIGWSIAYWESRQVSMASGPSDSDTNYV